MNRELGKPLGTWPFPAADEHQRTVKQGEVPPSTTQPAESTDPVEQELVEEQLARDREASRKVSPPR